MTWLNPFKARALSKTVCLSSAERAELDASVLYLRREYEQARTATQGLYPVLDARGAVIGYVRSLQELED